VAAQRCVQLFLPPRVATVHRIPQQLQHLHAFTKPRLFRQCHLMLQLQRGGMLTQPVAAGDLHFALEPGDAFPQSRCLLLLLLNGG
jgi:hypothetical protein